MLEAVLGMLTGLVNGRDPFIVWASNVGHSRSRDLFVEAVLYGDGILYRGNPTFGIRSDDTGNLPEVAEAGCGVRVPIAGELLIEGNVTRSLPPGLGAVTGISAVSVFTPSISLLLYPHMF